MKLRSLFKIGPPNNLKEIIKNNALIIDVRSETEFAEGRYKDSINIPTSQLLSNLEMIKNHSGKIIVVCKSGMRSAHAKGVLKREGIAAINGGGWSDIEKLMK